jgi:hypothetical protein
VVGFPKQETTKRIIPHSTTILSNVENSLRFSTNKTSDEIIQKIVAYDIDYL